MPDLPTTESGSHWRGCLLVPLIPVLEAQPSGSAGGTAFSPTPGRLLEASSWAMGYVCGNQALESCFTQIL